MDQRRRGVDSENESEWCQNRLQSYHGLCQQYGTARYFDTDAFLNPADMVEDVKAIFKNPVIRPYKCPQDCLLAPFDNGAAVNYKMILEFLFE